LYPIPVTVKNHSIYLIGPQKTLLRAVENGQVARIGETDYKEVDVCYILASNLPPPEYGLVHDLLARLRVVMLPSVKERIADIPSMFCCFLHRASADVDVDVPLDEILRFITADHYETLCLNGFPRDNLRGLFNTARWIVESAAYRSTPIEAVANVFESSFRDSPVIGRGPVSASTENSKRARTTLMPKVSNFVKKKTSEKPNLRTIKRGEVDPEDAMRIVDAYNACMGRVSLAVEYLKNKHGIRISRGRLTKIVDEYGFPRMKRGRG
jgi:DNA-binding NtrC family response regulator